MKTTNKEIKEKEERLLSFKQEVEGLHDITDAEEYARQLAHLFLGNGLSLQTILLMAIDFGQQHPHWIPVEEELPPASYGVLSDPVLVFIGNNKGWYGYIREGVYNHAAKEWSYTNRGRTHKVTHWMLIVPPRKEDKE